MPRIPMSYVLHVLGELRMKYRSSDDSKTGNPWVSILYVSRETCTTCGPKRDQEIMQTTCDGCLDSWVIDHKIRTANALMMTKDDVRAAVARSIALAAQAARARRAARDASDVSDKIMAQVDGAVIEPGDVPHQRSNFTQAVCPDCPHNDDNAFTDQANHHCGTRTGCPDCPHGE